MLIDGDWLFFNYPKESFIQKFPSQKLAQEIRSRRLAEFPKDNYRDFRTVILRKLEPDI